ncbi:aspartate carbamoyltransferase [Candidatus Marinamargulisbacteria bacterium SCGC AG-439-L15]|nr:aspartate carbamoyltransferase [Candidatus Marinamargulisbacteria bacterium SCGC AG-439-L15]
MSENRVSHLLSTKSLTKDTVASILKQAQLYQDHFESGGAAKDDLKGKILATLFFEPSTRTRLSFESAMLRLGGAITSMEGIHSSVKKGESLIDMGRILSGYADIVAMRHPTPHAVTEFATKASVPVINAGDGANEHPTQALLDLYTIQREKGTLEGLKIGFLGDLKYGRTVHSLVALLEGYKNELHFISDPSLQIPDDKRQAITASGVSCVDHEHVSECIGELDVLYATRLQEERFEDRALYERLSETYRITPETIASAKEELCLLHPLPKINEIDPAVDKDPRAKYFDQAQNGLYVRMAILAELLG